LFAKNVSSTDQLAHTTKQKKSCEIDFTGFF